MGFNSALKVLISIVTTIYNEGTQRCLKQQELQRRNLNSQSPWNNVSAAKGSAAHRDGDAVVTKARILNPYPANVENRVNS
jgi:hypothetical protein